MMSKAAHSLPPDAAPHLDAVLQRVRDGQTDGIEPLQALLERFPESPQILGHLAWAFACQGRYEESVAMCRRHLALVPDDLETRWRMADRLVNLGRLDEALETYQAVLKGYPECDDARMGVRYVQYRMRSGSQFDGADGPGSPALRPEQEANRALNQTEFEQGRIRLRSLPHSLQLESTTKCNFYCLTCLKGHGPYYAEDLHPDVLEKVRAELMPTNAAICVTGYGEPSLASNFDAILRMALDNDSAIHFVTNGSLLNWRRIEWLTRHSVNIGISMDGATRETFEAVRAGGSFDRVCETLAMIRKLRDIHLSQFRALFMIFVVALRKNIHELPDIVRLARRYAIGRVEVTDYEFHQNPFDAESLRGDPERANRYLDEAKRVAEELGISLAVPPPYSVSPAALQPASLWTKIRATRRWFSAPRRFPRRCSSPWFMPYIQTNGDVTACCMSGVVMGDLTKRSFRAIWNGWRFRLWRWRIHSALPPYECRVCVANKGINGGNPGSVMAKEGLFVKAFYSVARRFQRWAASGRRVWAKMLGQEVRRPPEPNYLCGRPIKKAIKDE